MAFPVSPTDGQLSTVNGITYQYSSADNSWTRYIGTISNLTIANQFTTATLVTGNVASNLIPSANVTYNLGSSDYRWKDLYLSGSSIVIGSETISVSDGTFAFTSNGGAQTGNVFLGNVDTSGKLIVNDDTNAIPYVMGSGAFHVVGGMSIGKDFWVGGNIYVANVISQSTTILEVNEPLVYLDASDYPYNYDIGVFSDFIGGSANAYQYTGAVRSYQTNEWVFFSNLKTTPGAGIVSITSANVIYDPIKAGNIIAANTTPSTSSTTGALIVKGGAGFAANIFTAGWIIPSGNVSQNLGSSTQWWNLVYGKSVQAQYADLAENYVADKNYVPGTVVVFGGDAEITATSTDHDPRVAGVISTNPAYLMNAVTTGQPVALTGRVPCMVLGPVDKGDRLVTSKMSGVAQRLVDGRYVPGCIFAKSLEKIERSEVKLIEVAVGRD